MTSAPFYFHVTQYYTILHNANLLLVASLSRCFRFTKNKWAGHLIAITLNSFLADFLLLLGANLLIWINLEC